MRTLISALVALVLLGASGTALAHNCPNEMKAIDARLADDPMLSAEDMEKVIELRAEGEALHNAGKHDESMAVLGEAKAILDI
ncbi:hypothetical protein [Zobellella maritima]|uniref:hypothetical protein n=1 Tax=Zobellella maritima TaxID=2059725 RepID=UPI000E3053E9|nr:hypothetical protein [Zobellella maritima]